MQDMSARIKQYTWETEIERDYLTRASLEDQS